MSKDMGKYGEVNSKVWRDKYMLDKKWECDYCDEKSQHNHITEQMLISIANSLKDIADSLRELNKRRINNG